MQPDPDRSLVDAASAGDRDAFSALVLRYQVRIVNLARALTADDGEADDLAQETFIRAYKGIGRFRGESTFRTWLYRVALNVINSHLKSRAKRWHWWGRSLDEREFDGETDRAAKLQSPSTPIDEDTARRQLIDRALTSLPAEMRTVVTLRDIHGFDYAEISAMLGIPMGTVESRIFRARQRLRPLLAELIERPARRG
jgi:RNA polymerase sigma-70 factor (ECF subfamily)